MLAEELIERAVRLGGLADDLSKKRSSTSCSTASGSSSRLASTSRTAGWTASYYDTLASEARLASFVAIATGKIPHEHWFKLGRSLTPAGIARALLSWSASMFEYFMPLLVMRTYPGTLLDETYRAVVQRQIQYAAQRRVPWGISESAYNAQDLDGNYQYRAFGVPGLGLKRGLADDLVDRPLREHPRRAARAGRRCSRTSSGSRGRALAGRYGFYEAIDYTPERLPEDHTGGVVLPTYMAHHQGMSLVALDNALNDVADAAAVSRRPAGAGGRAAAAGTHPAPGPA